MRRRFTPRASAALGLLLFGSLLTAETGAEFLERRVRPLPVEQCTQCRGEELRSAEIDFRLPA